MTLPHSTLAAMASLRWSPDESVELRVLGERANGPHPARILEVSGNRARLATAAALAAGDAMRLDWGGQLLLGQVLNCEPEGCWIEIHHLLIATDPLLPLAPGRPPR